jgi:hypothetical protein
MTQPNRFAISLEALEDGVRVPVSEQVEVQPDDTDLHTERPWEDERRQVQLAGGA